MPLFDESFVREDEANQRKNKRSYAVHKQQSLQPVSILKHNIRCLRERNKAGDKNNETAQQDKAAVEKVKKLNKFNSKLNDIRNNNALSACRSLESLTEKENKESNGFPQSNGIRNGVSLSNLLQGERKRFVGFREPSVEKESEEECTSYSVRDAVRRRRGRPDRYRRRRRADVVSLDAGVYRILDYNESEGATEHTSGHRGSLRGANKLARRARSFKDDLMERITAMRSPAQSHHHQPHLPNVFRSHPISPKMHSTSVKSSGDNGEVTPAKELEQLVKEVQFELKHFCDVITKDKLEMLPGNGRILYDTLISIHRAIKPYSNHGQIGIALQETCLALADVMRVCDEAVRSTDPSLLHIDHVHKVVQKLLVSVQEVTRLASSQLSRPALAPRPPLAVSSTRVHRNSLPDIPLSERERQALGADGGPAGTGVVSGVRASHSSESVLDDPPPKPPHPRGKLNHAPPLPPKRRNNTHIDSLLPTSLGIDSRLSLQSHSSGSLDSLLNTSHDDEIRAIMDPTNHHAVALCSCASEESLNNGTERTVSFSAESGFVSMGREFQQRSSTHSASLVDTTDSVFTEIKSTMQSISVKQSSHLSTTSSSTYNDNSNETAPELPTKTRRPLLDPNSFPGVELRRENMNNCAVHGSRHTLALLQKPVAPPLPLKKKHIMAYMEMFGNCSHPSAEHAEMFRHSIHVYNMATAESAHGIAQSMTLHHFSTQGYQSGSGEFNTSSSTSIQSRESSPEPPELPPKMSRLKQQYESSRTEPLPSLQEVRSQSRNSCKENSSSLLNDSSLLNSSTQSENESVFRWSSPGPGKFQEELDILENNTPSPLPQAKSPNAQNGETVDIILESNVSQWLTLEESGDPVVRGGNPDALIVLATKSTKEFAYQEAFLCTYRTWETPDSLVYKLIRRVKVHRHKPHLVKPTLALLTRVVADLTPMELDERLLKEIADFVYWLIESEELPIAKAMRLILLDKYKSIQAAAAESTEISAAASSAPVRLKRETILEFKAGDIAKQMTLLDASLFAQISVAEVLSWPKDQSEEKSPNLTRFTEHFNKMSYWARSRILERDEPKEREKIALKLLKVMKALRKLNNFNSYLALLSAVDSAPIRRLDWTKTLKDALQEHSRLIDSSSSFSNYRKALSETQPPAIPYIGIILQDLTFVHIGNRDELEDGGVNFSKRWQQYHIMENMKRFQNTQYVFHKNERILAMFGGFDDVMSEETMWQISESIRPRGGRKQEALVEAAA